MPRYPRTIIVNSYELLTFASAADEARYRARGAEVTAPPVKKHSPKKRSKRASSDDQQQPR